MPNTTLRKILIALAKEYPEIGFDDETTRDPIYITPKEFGRTVSLLLDVPATVSIWPLDHTPRHGQTVGVMSVDGVQRSFPLVWTGIQPEKRRILLMLDRNEQVLDMINVPVATADEYILENYSKAIRLNPETKITTLRLVEVREERTI